MGFLDLIKKRKWVYMPILAIGTIILVLNNLVQFYGTIFLESKWLSLLSFGAMLLLIRLGYKNKEEVMK
jgi:hypothetical protein